MNAKIDRFADRRVVEFELQIVDRDRAVVVNDPVHPEAKYVFKGFKGRRNEEFPEDILLFPQGSLIAKMRDFFGGGMDPFVIIIMDLAEQDLVGFGDGNDVVPGADADDMVLQPAVGAFDFAFGLR